MILLLVLLASYWAPPYLTWALVTGVVLARLSRERNHLGATRRVLLAFAAVFAVGAPGLFKHEWYDAAKDAWYFSKPIVEIAFGLWVAARLSTRQILRVYVLAAAVVSAHYVGSVALDWPLYVAQDTNANRVYFGPGSFLSLIAIGFLWIPSYRRVLLDGAAPLARAVYWTSGVLSVAALTFSRSRTLGILALVLAATRVLVHTRWRVPALAVSVVAAASLALHFDDADLPVLAGALRAIDEMALTERSSPEDVGANWRGHEGFLALREFDGFDLGEKAIGGGWGHRITLDTTRQLAGVDYESIPMLHNGFLFVLVKGGLVGLALYAAALIALGRRLLKDARPDERALGIWLVSMIVLSTAVISGPYNRTELLPVCVLSGVALWLRAAARVRPSVDAFTNVQASTAFRS